MRPISLPALVLYLILFALTSPALGQTPVQVGGELQLNTYTTGNQLRPRVATTPEGFLVVWDGRSGQDSSGSGVVGLRLAPDGSAVGQEFQVNSYVDGDQYEASVSANSSGFVVVWQSYGSDGTDDDYGIHGQRYASDGSPIASQFQVNTYTPNYQGRADIAVAPSGDFLVVWESDGSAGNDSVGGSVQGRFYTSDGQAVGADFQVNTTTSDGQLDPSVVVDSGGQFTVVWPSGTSAGNDNDLSSIQLQRFAPDGSPLGTETQVNAYTTGFQTTPAIAAAPNGDLVVAWTGQFFDSDPTRAIVARLVDSSGTPLGGDFLVNTYTTGDQEVPAIHIAEDGGFVITWRSAAADNGDSDVSSLQGQRFGSDGSKIGAQFLVNTYTTGFQARARVAGDGSGDFIAFWDGGSSGTDSGDLAVKAQLFRVTGDVGGRTWRDDNGNGVQDGGEPDLPGLTVELYDDLGGRVAQATTGVDGRYTLKAEAGNYTVNVIRPATFAFSPRDEGDDASDSDVDALGESAPFAMTVAVSSPDIDAGLVPIQVGDRVWRDLNENGVQDGGEPGVPDVTVTLRTAGGLETAQTTTDGSGRYSLAVEAGSYFLELTPPAGEVFSPRDTGGDDALDSDADSAGRTAVFNLAGNDSSWDAGLLPLPSATAAGDDFQVNTYTTGVQNVPAIAMDADGDFVIVYSSPDDGSSFGIRGQRFDSAGSPAGAEFLVNSTTLGTQRNPEVSMAGTGEFVVVWTAFLPGASVSTIEGQRFAADGSPLGLQFQVNSLASGFHFGPRPAMDDTGAFVVVWLSDRNDNGDGSGYSVQARRFAPDGMAIGDDFLVNDITTSHQTRADVDVDADHGFVVTWMSYEYQAFGSPESERASGTVEDNSPPSIQAKRFATDGSAIGSEFQVNDYVTGSQREPSVAFLDSGDFAIVFESTGSAQGDDDEESLLLRRFATDGTALGSELQVNTYTTGSQQRVKVAAAPSGEFVVIWDSEGSADGLDSDLESVQGQRFNASGERIDDEFTVNSLTQGVQSDAGVAMDSAGDFAVTWASLSVLDVATSVRARRFRVTGDLGDRVFMDSDGDGVQDPSEPGVSGVGVELYDAEGALIASTTTDGEGRYSFPKVAQGDYTLRIPLIPGEFTGFTFQDVGGDDVTDSDFDASGRTAPLTVEAAETDLDQDAGLLINSLGDRVWLDSNLNGRQDGGEPGFSGVTVELFTLGGLSLGQAVTASDGTYAFEAVTPGSYRLTFSEPDGFCYTAQDRGDDTGDSDVDPSTLATGTIVVSPNQSDLSWDAGLVPDASIGHRVWLDDGNGIQDGGEQGVQGVTVRLWSDQDVLLETAVTDGEGLYSFAPGPGDYYLEVALPTNMAFAPQDQGADDGADSDFNGVSGRTAVFTLAPGAVDATRDAGLEPATLGDRVWLDTNRDGRQQPTETGLAGVTVRLLNASNVEIASTVSGATGLYGFLGIPSGNYRIEVTLPVEAVFSSQDVGSDDLIDSDVDPATGRTAVFAYSAGSASRSHDAGVIFPPFFADGFETGDVSEWSFSSP